MHNSAAAQFYTRDISTNAKRFSQPPTQTNEAPKRAAVGIIIAIIVFASGTIITLLILRLIRQHRMERRKKQQVDLLEEASPAIGPADMEKGLYNALHDEKPLPRTPGRTSTQGITDSKNFRKSVFVRKSFSVPTIRLPSPVAHGKENVVPNAFSNTSGSFSHSRPPPASSLGQQLAHARSDSNPFASKHSAASDVFRGQLTVINVTDTDMPPLERAQSIAETLPEYKSGVRGRHPAFPSKMDRNAGHALITAQEDMHVGLGDLEVSSVGSVYSLDSKRPVVDVPLAPKPPSPEPSYTVHLPPTTSTTGSSLAPPRVRQPLTITASRPVSNIVVEESRRIRKPNGMQGKGRIVTMSVLVEESDTSNSELDPQSALTSRSHTSSDILGQVVEAYANRDGDLPPYTPRDR